MIKDWFRIPQRLLESKAGHVGTCTNSFSDRTGECVISRHLPYRDVSHFADAVESHAVKVNKEHFLKHATVSKELTPLLHKKSTEFYHDKEHGVHMMYDTKKDVHHFYTESNKAVSTIKKVLRTKYKRDRQLI